MSEREVNAGYVWMDDDMPGFGVEYHGRHGYHPVRIWGEDEHEQLGPRTWGWSGYDRRAQAWRFIQRKYFPKSVLRGRK